MNAIVSSMTHIFSCYRLATAQLEFVSPSEYAQYGGEKWKLKKVNLRETNRKYQSGNVKDSSEP